MPTIMLRDGDFGSGLPATIDLTALYLPDPERPGTVVIVPFGDIAEVDSLKDDNSARLKAGLKLSARGFAAAGPIGLAAGLLAARHVKDILFSVRLKDGRQFTAIAGAVVFSDLHSAQLNARAEADAMHGQPDHLIEKYLRANPPELPPAAPATPMVATVASPAPPLPPGTARPVFGRRGR